jgi:hypothetical protein
MRSLRPLLVTAMLFAGACSPPEPAAPAPAEPASSAADPRAAPGLVRWHESVAAAQAAARASGKPLLVFQLLGRLDDEFC